MRKITIQIRQGETVMATRVVAVTIFGDVAVHHPHDDDERLYYELTHISSGRAILDDFVIDARLSLSSLTPVISEIAGIFRDRTTPLTEIDKAVINALIRVIERMEAELPTGIDG